MKKNYKQLANSVKRLANELNEEGRSLLEEIAAQIEELAANTDDDGKDEITAKLAELTAKLARVEEAQSTESEEVAERIQAIRNEMAGMVKSHAKVEDKLTAEVRKEIVNAIDSTKGGREAVKDAVMRVLKKNDISDLSFNQAVRIAVAFESKPTELFDAFGRTDLDLVYLVGIDEEDKDQIAKQWTDNPAAAKDVQQLAAEGIQLNTKYIYKKQRMANEALDDAREHGVLADVESETARELEQQVKRAAEKAAIVGDNINDAGKKVTTFQAIGKTTTTNGRVTVVHPAGATPNIVDLATAADAVEGAVAEKVCVISKTLARTISQFLYASGGSTHIISDAEIAAQIGVDRLVKVDYLSEVNGLHAVILKPNAYKVRIKNEMRVAYPKYENNSLYYLYEMNMGGALVELKSAAVLTSARGSSSK